MVCDTLSDGYANKGKAHASISNHHGHTCEHVLTRGHTHVHACAFLPCVSVDWVNQPNFPFFFSVRSARVTPWRYQHAVHTARQQRQQWTSTEQREGGGRERKREIERERRTVRQEKAAGHTTVQTQLLHPGKHPNRKKSSAKPEPGLCFPRIIHQSRIKSICKEREFKKCSQNRKCFFFMGIHISQFFKKNLIGQKKVKLNTGFTKIRKSVIAKYLVSA